MLYYSSNVVKSVNTYVNNITVLDKTDRYWYAIATLAGVPRIVCIEDWKIGAGGFTYVKCRMMLSGDVVWLEESNIIRYVEPPSNLGKPCEIDLFDEVRLSDLSRGEIVAIHGDLVVVIDTTDENADARLIERWHVLYVVEKSNFSEWLDATRIEAAVA